MKHTNILLGVLSAVLGLIMLLDSTVSLMLIVILAGAGVILSSVKDIYKTRSYSEDPSYRNVVVARSIISFIVGILAILLPVYLASTVIHVIMIILAVYFFVKAACGVYMITRISDDRISSKKVLFSVLEAVLAGIFLLILDGKTAAAFIIKIAGLILLIGGAGYTYYAWKESPLVVDPEDVRDEE